MDDRPVTPGLLLVAVAFGVGILLGAGFAGAAVRWRLGPAALKAAQRAVADAHEAELAARDPFTVPGGFGVVVRTSGAEILVQATQGVTPEIVAPLLRDAADLCFRDPRVTLQ